ncbi:uncharacterized protein PgNI_02834 [Pyricularia grisea]|uniref:Uncharacterized protein n=1 Tax=Pyricularia grisea TaxID=148305 RepID=A0A6P8BF54_PYRGI|nr:uncharacterized protein PgNI_02834 [Pyricularia grisea]TLD14359.1 hypothetical protein PgNI_02834 [Pyricularia grisea]
MQIEELPASHEAKKIISPGLFRVQSQFVTSSTNVSSLIHVEPDELDGLGSSDDGHIIPLPFVDSFHLLHLIGPNTSGNLPHTKMVVLQDSITTLFLGHVMLCCCAPSYQRLFITPKGQGENPSWPGERFVSYVFDESVHVCQLGAEGFGNGEISVELGWLRAGFEDDGKHGVLMMSYND